MDLSTLLQLIAALTKLAEGIAKRKGLTKAQFERRRKEVESERAGAIDAALDAIKSKVPR